MFHASGFLEFKTIFSIFPFSFPPIFLRFLFESIFLLTHDSKSNNDGWLFTVKSLSQLRSTIISAYSIQHTYASEKGNKISNILTNHG